MPADLENDMVPVAFITHSPLAFLPSALAQDYEIPGYSMIDKTTGQEKENKVILVQQTVNYKNLAVIAGTSDPTSENLHVTVDGLKALLDEIGMFHVQFW